MFGGYLSSLRDFGTIAYYYTLVLASLSWRTVTEGPWTVFYVKKRETKPSVLDDPALGSHQFARLKEVTLHYVENGSEEKPLMLLIHGFPEFWYSWRHQLKEFCSDYRVVAVDNRGYGESDKPSGIAAYTTDKLVEDVKEIIEYLGYQKAVVVSHDWGGVIAFLFAAKYPDMVERLIGCNTIHPSAMQHMLRSNPKQRKLSWYYYFYQWPVLPILAMRANDLENLERVLTGKRVGCKQGAITEEDLDAFKYNFQNYSDLTGGINYYRALYRYPTKDPSCLRKIVVPTVMIWGTNDMALSKEVAEETGKYCDNYRIRYIEGGSHWIQQDEPSIVNKYIKEFLSDSKIPSKL